MKAQGVWWVSFTWLMFGLGVLLHFASRWTAGTGDPLRHELGIGITMAFVYTLPAAIAASVLALAKFGLAKTQRRLGACVAVMFLLIFLAFSAASAAVPNNALQATRENARA